MKQSGSVTKSQAWTGFGETPARQTKLIPRAFRACGVECTVRLEAPQNFEMVLSMEGCHSQERFEPLLKCHLDCQTQRITGQQTDHRPDGYETVEMFECAVGC